MINFLLFVVLALVGVGAWALLEALERAEREAYKRELEIYREYAHGRKR